VHSARRARAGHHGAWPLSVSVAWFRDRASAGLVDLSRQMRGNEQPWTHARLMSPAPRAERNTAMNHAGGTRTTPQGKPVDGAGRLADHPVVTEVKAAELQVGDYLLITTGACTYAASR
jgi:hypothetical protein